MVILHLSSGLAECGIKSYTDQLIRELPGEPRRATPHDDWPLDGVDVAHVQFFGGGFPEGKLAQCRQTCRQRSLPFVVTLHNCLPLVLRLDPDHLFVHTTQSRAEAIQLGFDPARITHIPHGVPLVIRATDPEPETAVLFGFLLPHKGVLEALEAVHHLRGRRPEIRLLLQTPLHPPNMAASQRLAEEVAARIHQFGLDDQVEFHTTFRPEAELSAFLSRASVFLFPYTSDAAQASSAAGRVGMAYGRPSLVADLPLFEGVAGARRVRPGDTVALHHALDALLGPEGDLLAEEAKEGARAASWQVVAAQVAGVYDALRAAPPVPVAEPVVGYSSTMQGQLNQTPPHEDGQLFVRLRAGGPVPLSFSHVLCGWAQELLRRGHRVGIDGLAPQHERLLAPNLPERAMADWEINFTYPPRFQFSPHTVRRAEVLCWETTHYPEHWAQLAGSVDRVLTLSPFSMASLVASGVPEARIALVPPGVERQIFHPEGERVDWQQYGADPGATVFFQVGALDSRKGTPLLLRAYLAAFTAQDNTLLFIKNNSFAGFYNLRELVAGMEEERPNRHQLPARIHVRSEDWPAPVLAAHMRSASVGVFPYQAEGGFGLPPLEMLACGVPVIVSDFGAPPDYVDADNGWRLPGRLVPSAFRSHHHIEHPQARWFEPDEEALVTLLRAVHAMNPEERQRRGAVGAVTATRYGWDVAGGKLLEALR